MTSTIHLDTAIRIFGGSATATRGKRSSTIAVTVHTNPQAGTYMVQVGSRITAEGVGCEAVARKAGEDKAEALRGMGHRAKVVLY